MRTIIGIDPGVSGAIALLDGNYLDVHDMPLVETIAGNGKKRHQLDPQAFRDIIINAGPCTMVVLEQPSTRPGESPISSMSAGVGFGMMVGVLVALERPYRVIRPQVWTGALDVGSNKDVHRCRAAAIFPHSSSVFSRKKDNGRADAALIAYWGTSQGVRRT